MILSKTKKTKQKKKTQKKQWKNESFRRKFKLMKTNDGGAKAAFQVGIAQTLPQLTGVSKNVGCSKLTINTSTKITWINFDDLVRQCYWVWGDMTSLTI